MAADLGTTVPELIRDGKLRAKIKLETYVTPEVGLPTLTDIMAELAKPGRDPREKFEVFAFSADVHRPEDLKPGMKLPGIVTNVTAFGAFVDIGVHQDGLVHVSQLADSFVKEPSAVVKPGQKFRSPSRKSISRATASPSRCAAIPPSVPKPRIPAAPAASAHPAAAPAPVAAHRTHLAHRPP